MKLAVIGNKEFNDFSKLEKALKKYGPIETIVSGGAVGTDSLAAKYAQKKQIKLLVFPPNYQKYGAAAKHLRDRLIVDNADRILAFWNGNCEGTSYTLNYATKQGKPIEIIMIKIC